MYWFALRADVLQQVLPADPGERGKVRVSLSVRRVRRADDERAGHATRVPGADGERDGGGVVSVRKVERIDTLRLRVDLVEARMEALGAAVIWWPVALFTLVVVLLWAVV